MGTLPEPPGQPGKDDVELYVRTYTTILRSSGDIRLRAFASAHQRMRSSLHTRSDRPDTGAFIYTIQRLPAVVSSVQRVVLGQEGEQFRALLGPSVSGWPRLEAPARRRHWRWDGAQTMTVHVASPSDLDDLIPCLVAYQIEWNKLHDLLGQLAATRSGRALLAAGSPSARDLEAVRVAVVVEPGDWLRLRQIWGDSFWGVIQGIAAAEKDMTVRLLGGHDVGYTRLVRRWWEPIGGALAAGGLAGRPLYFISSNMHSVVNLVSGYARRRAPMLWALLEESGQPRRLAEPTELTELSELAAIRGSANAENVLYYAARLWHRLYGSNAAKQERRDEEQERGIVQVEPEAGFEVGAQLLELARLRPEDLDPRLAEFGAVAARSDAVILNVDYPLGQASYHILRQVCAEVPSLRGAYAIGKAATLNGAIGDVMVSNVVYDEYSRNTYTFDNAFSYGDIGPFLERGSALDNQKSVTVRGTFLQNREYLDFYYREQFTVVEMEAGPLLAALYEASNPTRYPTGEHVHYRDLPFDFGVLHYASDTPYTQARTLGSRRLSFEGIDSTYAATVAVLRRILKLEAARQQANRPVG